MEKTFIPEDNSVASIKIREQIIRDFYRVISIVNGRKGTPPKENLIFH